MSTSSLTPHASNRTVRGVTLHISEDFAGWGGARLAGGQAGDSFGSRTAVTMPPVDGLHRLAKSLAERSAQPPAQLPAQLCVLPRRSRPILSWPHNKTGGDVWQVRRSKRPGLREAPGRA